MSHNDITYETVSHEDVYPVYGVMCSNTDHFCSCEHFYCDGSVRHVTEEYSTTTYNDLNYPAISVLLLEDGSSLRLADGSKLSLED